MKPATFFLAFTLILLFTKPSLSSRAIVDDTLVYDGDGNPLQKGASYFISPPIRGPLGDAVTLASPNGKNETCSEAYVVQLFLNFDPAIPFTFTPVAVNEDAIKLGSPLAIQSAESPCEGSTVWQVSSRIGVPGNIITTGGIINTPSSCLRIIKSEAAVFGGYMFEYCPNLCGAGPKICLLIGNNMGGLSPKGERPFEFVLRKASESAAAI